MVCGIKGPEWPEENKKMVSHPDDSIGLYICHAHTEARMQLSWSLPLPLGPGEEALYSGSWVRAQNLYAVVQKFIKSQVVGVSQSTFQVTKVCNPRHSSMGQDCHSSNSGLSSEYWVNIHSVTFTGYEAQSSHPRETLEYAEQLNTKFLPLLFRTLMRGRYLSGPPKVVLVISSAPSILLSSRIF